MEHYDVIIVGAGIAGTGLAYNLYQEGYKGSVLVIDKNQIGENIKQFRYRNTFKEVIDEYNLPFEHKFKGLKMGTCDKIYSTIDHSFYFVDYTKICSAMLKCSNADFHNAKAECINNKILVTDKSKYEFKYIIDCSGNTFFLKNSLNRPKPFKYFIGNLNIYKGKVKKSSNYFYFLSEKRGFVEDVYPLHGKILQGEWQITSIVDFNLIKPVSQYFKTIIENPSLVSREQVFYPISPVLPLTYKYYALLGDSFGNATPSTGEGIRPILDSSKLLASSIKKSNLKAYEKDWKNKYLGVYLRNLAFKMDISNRLDVIKVLKDYPDIMLKLIKNEKIDLPKTLRRRFSRKFLFKQLYYNSILNLKYSKLNYLNW